MTKEPSMIIATQAKSAAITTSGGAVVGVVTYFGALSITDIQIMAAIFAALMTGLYFSFMALRTALQVLWDVQDRRKANKK